MRIHSRTTTIARATGLALALAFATGAAAAHDHDGRKDGPGTAAMTAPQVRAALEAQGYTDIDDLDFDGGMWTADAKTAEGSKVDLRIDARTGQVYPDKASANLGEADIRAQLSAAGYTNVHDVEFDDGLWQAKADDRNGRGIDLRLDATTGAIVGRDR